MLMRPHRLARAACALATSLAGACSPTHEEQVRSQRGGEIFSLETASRYQLIDGFNPLRITRTNADIIDGTPQATITVSWSAGVNVPEGRYQTLKLGESAPLNKVGTLTLLELAPPAKGKRWPTPVVCFKQETRLMNTARQYAADTNLYFRPDDQEARQP